MKKLLALVLTLVMTMSLMTVSNAATFDDDAAIDYKEAVEVMAAVGVLAGDGTGDFNPAGELTRAAAAKIVTYLMIGADAAEGLAVSAAPFSDVPADHWAAGYISYLVSEGVVAGVGDGKFDPNGDVTALQFAKMLLVALSYDATLEKLVGADWSIATSKLAYDKELFEGNDSISVNKVATRQEAALYAFNALNAVYVEYATKGTTVKVEGAEVITGASSASDNDDNAGSPKKLFEKLYKNDLKKFAGTGNAYGHPATKWTYKAAEVGTFASTPVVTFTTEFNANELIDAVEAAGAMFDTEVNAPTYADVSVAFYKNGASSTPEATKGPAAVDSWLTTYAKTDFAWSAKGVKVEVFANDDDIVNRIVVTESILASVDTKREDKVGTKTIDERQLTLTDTTSYSYVLNADDEVEGFETVFAAIEEGDPVVVIKDANNASKAIKVYVPATATGDVSYYSAGKSLTVGGTSYSNSKNAVIDSRAGDEGVTLFLDEFGYALGDDGGSTAADSLVVLDLYKGLNANGAIVDMYYVLYADGTTARVEKGTMAGFGVTGTPGVAYLYDTNDDDQTCLKAIPSAVGTIDDSNEGETYAVGAQTILESAKSIALGSGRSYFAANAQFIYVSQDSNLNWQFTVSDKLQDLTLSGGDAAVAIDADGNISAMYVLGVKASNTVKDGSALIFVADTDGTASKLDKDGKMTDLYVYDAFIDGVKVEGFVSENSVSTGLFYENEYDTENGWYVLSGNVYNDAAEDIKVTGAESITKDTIYSNKYITVDSSVDVELTSSTKYASNIDELEIGSLAELKAEIVDGETATIYVVYDNETGVALYVYITNIA